MIDAVQDVDERWMAAALALARRGLGRTAPNPAVGCVLVRDGRLVAQGWTQPGGRPHAETEALDRAGDGARGATAYVTLEPCAHHGVTPPCTQALVRAGVARVVTATDDPDPRVAGRGHTQLRDAGVAVTEGVLRAEADALNAGFFLRVREKRPLVSLKLAQTLDGRIATATGESQWITGPEARARGHLLRAEHDAVLVGIETALADDPALTCRLPGLADRSPVRVVLDSACRLPPTSVLAQTAAAAPTWVVTREGARSAALTELGVEVIGVAADGEGRVDVMAALRAMAARGITRLLVEGGAGVAASLTRQGLVDLLHVFAAGRVFGGDGRAAIAPLGVETLAEAPRFRHIHDLACGPDRLHVWTRSAP